MRSTHKTVIKAGKKLKDKFDDKPFSKVDFDREMQRLGGYAPNSILPSDYCYNLINRAPVAFRYPVFERLERGKYRYLGPNYGYTGPIFWKHKQVGEWKSGELTLWEDPRRRLE